MCALYYIHAITIIRIAITVFPRLNAVAFIFFTPLAGAALIRGRRLFEGGVYYFRTYTSRKLLLLRRTEHVVEKVQ